MICTLIYSKSRCWERIEKRVVLVPMPIYKYLMAPIAQTEVLSESAKCINFHLTVSDILPGSSRSTSGSSCSSRIEILPIFVLLLFLFLLLCQIAKAKLRLEELVLLD